MHDGQMLASMLDDEFDRDTGKGKCPPPWGWVQTNVAHGAGGPSEYRLCVIRLVFLAKAAN